MRGVGQAARKVVSTIVGAPIIAIGSFCTYEIIQQRRFHVNNPRVMNPTNSPQVVVVGGGIVGIATAYFFMLRGFKVTLLEQEPGPGRVTSGASGCLLSVTNCKPMVSSQYFRRVIIAIWKGDPWLEVAPGAIFDFEFIRWSVRVVCACFAVETQKRSEEFLRRHSQYFVKLIHEIAETEGFVGDFNAAQHGLLTIYSRIDAFENARNAAETSGAVALSRAEVVHREPFLKSAGVSIVGAIFAPADGHGDCGRFTELLAKACEKRGVTFRYSAHVESLKISHLDSGASKIVAAVLSNGQEVNGDLFVVAMGSQSPRLLSPIGVDLPIYPVKGYSYEIDCTKMHGLKSPVVFADHQLGAIPLGSRLRFSSVAEFAGWEESVPSPRVASRFRADLEDLFPDIVGGDTLDGAKLIVGGRPTTPDDLPIVSGTRFDNLMVNAGHCMKGWRTACGSAAVLVAIVTGTKVPDDIDTKILSLSRFQITHQS